MYTNIFLILFILCGVISNVSAAGGYRRGMGKSFEDQDRPWHTELPPPDSGWGYRTPEQLPPTITVEDPDILEIESMIHAHPDNRNFLSSSYFFTDVPAAYMVRSLASIYNYDEESIFVTHAFGQFYDPQDNNKASRNLTAIVYPRLEIAPGSQMTIMFPFYTPDRLVPGYKLGVLASIIYTDESDTGNFSTVFLNATMTISEAKAVDEENYLLWDVGYILFASVVIYVLVWVVILGNHSSIITILAKMVGTTAKSTGSSSSAKIIRMIETPEEEEEALLKGMIGSKKANKTKKSK